MCGRYSLETSFDLFTSRYGLEIESVEFSNYPEIFPTQVRPIIDSKNHLVYGKWGFSTPYSNKSLINARLETVNEKPTFKQAFNETRCLIPATSFFEWEKIGDHKEKRKIFVDNRYIFSMAGICRVQDDRIVYSILTMDSTDDFKKIHHRMPVILDAVDELKYLNKNTPIKDVLSLCYLKQPELIVR